MELLSRYAPKTRFKSYEDFKVNFRLRVPEKFDFARDIVDEFAQGEPNRRALVYCDDEGYVRTFTFAEISELSRKAAGYFRSLGVRRGDRVLTLLRRKWEYWVCAVALHRIGAVVVPASIQLSEKDIAYRVDSADVRMILALNDEYVNKQIENLRDKCPSLRDIALVGGRPENMRDCRDFNEEFQHFGEFAGYDTLRNTDEMLVYFTSGTSGMPKMAVHDRTYPLGHIVTAKYMQRVRDGGLHLTLADSGWAKFGWGNIYGQWICGSAVLAYDPIRFHPENLLAVIQAQKPTSLCVPPTMYRFLMSAGLRKEHVQSVEWFSTAGEALSGEVNERFRELTGHYIREGFGQSEGTPITCSFEWLDVKPASMGRPSPLYNVSIARPDGSRCDIGETGEIVIYVAGPSQSGLLRFYGVKGEMRDPVQGGVYHTGDTAYEDEDGYYWYVGRQDDMIKCSGYRIGPFEIESVLNAHPAVRESAVVGAPDELRGQIVCAVVALREGFSPSPSLTIELQSYVKRNTAPYKYPRRIVYVDSLPKTTTGKIIRAMAKEMI